MKEGIEDVILDRIFKFINKEPTTELDFVVLLIFLSATDKKFSHLNQKYFILR